MANTPSDRPFAVALRRVRRHLDLGQEGLAVRLMTSRRTIVRWERGECDPIPHDHDDILRRLADVPRDLLAPLAQALGKALGKPLPPAVAGNEETKRILDAHLYALAEDADVSARRLREAIVSVLEKAGALGLTLESARAVLSAGGKSGASQ